jgi:hypothetical protein
MTRRAWAAALVFLFCSCSQQEHAVRLVRAVGPQRVREAADALRHPTPSPRDAFLEVPEASWPDAIKRLTPKSVWTTDAGVFVKLQSRFVEEEGIFVAFQGVSVASPGAEPSLEPIEERIFWYKIKG